MTNVILVLNAGSSSIQALKAVDLFAYGIGR